MIKTIITKGLVVLAVLMFPVAVSSPAAAEGLTKAQGDAILRELQQIRQLLQRSEQGRTASKKPRQQALQRTRVSSAKRPQLGEPSAPLTLVEFTDYQCPYCQRHKKNTFPLLKKAYIDTGKVRLVIKDLPLSFHKNARKAAQAAHCAGDQGKFWEMNNLLFNNAKQLDPPRLPGYAKQISLDVPAFESCLGSDRHLADIDKDSAQARAIGITGTPTFVLGRTTKDIIDGVRLRGAQPFQAFEAQIDALLKSIN